MRISTQQIFLSNIDNLNSSSAALFKTQQQLSTGKRVLQPSDDPLASAQIQKFKKEIARTEQFSANIEVADRRLSLEETTIEQINNLSIRLKELTIQGKNGVLSDGDRSSIASEVGEIVKSLSSLMNTKDVQGEYLFAGNKGFTEPYTYNESNGRYEFNGDDGQRYLQVGPENKVASTDSGFDIFETVPMVPGYIEADLTQTVSMVSNIDIDGGDAEAFGEYMAAHGPLTMTVDAAGLLTVTDKNGQVVTADDPAVPLQNQPINPTAPTFTIAGVELDVSGANEGTATLDVFDQHNILNTAMDLKEQLDTADLTTESGKELFNTKMDQILTNLSGIEELNIAARTSIGGRINTLEQQLLVNEDYILFTEEARSSFEDMDYNEAISIFTLQETALEASYASFAAIKDLSLFNYL
ncbi:flagellar hook-associated protein FlgL [Neptuniibacter sp. 2_MG-2023]|uniref:flagellar hook-associated protein FlgL n=1 Tax=Neptuniibacter sp. 2_MG-2023 TaxID=3062671 RepID=UPI0026E16706|nr:flagellar hook-associated protein FlgL [Neptuniibacter sp. 2_MG-2023]MDO6515437.1 flagellar hook-associated protein FlgL [Neptuniibacter sp. 2_MG-2023]